MKYKFLRFLRVVVAAFVLAALAAFFLDFDDKIPSSVAGLAKIQFLPSLLAGGFVVFAALLATTFLFGRLYCSVLCPLGIFQDFVAWFGRRFAGIAARRAAKKERRADEAVAQNAETAEAANSNAPRKPSSKRRPTGRNYAYRKNPLRVRVLFLALALLSFPLGGAYFALLEPYGIFGRIVVNVFKPIYVLWNNLCYEIGSHFESYAFYYVDLKPESWGALGLGIATFLILIAFAGRYGRLYCNSVCPVGTILGAISKFAFFKVKINADRCVGCGLCAKACKSSCVDVANRRVDSSRCVVCFDCFNACRKEAILFLPGKKAELGVPNAPDVVAPSSKNASQSVATPLEIARAERAAAGFDRGKREFLTLAALATTAAVARVAFADDAEEAAPANAAPGTSSTPEPETAAPVDAVDKPADYGLTPFKRERAISPPGSLSRERFQKLCVGCHLCVAKCPSHVLKPSGLENGLRGLMQPRLAFSRGFCNFDCVVCGEVCPTGAILPLTREEKHATQMGQVVFIKENCIVYAKNESCGACSEHCPTQAVKMVPYGDDLTIPETDPDLCVGCGACESICPARPFHAIYIEGNDVHQKAKPVENEETKEVENLDFGF